MEPAEAGTGETNSNCVMSKLLALLALLRLSTTEPGECSWSNDCLEGDRDWGDRSFGFESVSVREVVVGFGRVWVVGEVEMGG